MTETMTEQVPLVMGLDDARAVTAVVGGKGASLARLARAGFRVPPGFQVTTSAYLDFVDRRGLRESVLAAISGAGGSDEGGSDAAAVRIRELFAGQPLPDPTAAAIASAYAALGDDVPVAVRSSATVEDLPGMSAAGQHDADPGTTVAIQRVFLADDCNPNLSRKERDFVISMRDFASACGELVKLPSELQPNPEL